MNDPKYREKILKGKRNYISRRRDEPEYVLKEREYLEKYIQEHPDKFNELPEFLQRRLI